MSKNAFSFNSTPVVYKFEFLFLSTGRVVTQSTPVTPPRTITIGETISTVPQNTSGNSKVAISPLKSPSKVLNLLNVKTGIAITFICLCDANFFLNDGHTLFSDIFLMFLLSVADCGFSGQSVSKLTSEVCYAAAQRGSWPADPHCSTVCYHLSS